MSYQDNDKCGKELRWGRVGLCVGEGRGVREVLPEEQMLKPKLHLRNTRVGTLELSLKNEAVSCCWGQERRATAGGDRMVNNRHTET